MSIYMDNGIFVTEKEYDNFWVMIQDINLYLKTNNKQILTFYNKNKKQYEFKTADNDKLWYMSHLYKMIDQIKIIPHAIMYKFGLFNFYDWEKACYCEKITIDFIKEFADKIDYGWLLDCDDIPQDVKDYCRMFS